MADILLPEPSIGFEYVLVRKRRTLLEELREERDALKAQLDSMLQPTGEELKELGRLHHFYFEVERRLESVKAQISNLKDANNI